MPATPAAVTAAVAQAREYLGPRGVEAAKRVLGTGEAGIDSILRAAIEREIARLKATPVTNIFTIPGHEDEVEEVEVHTEDEPKGN